MAFDEAFLDELKTRLNVAEVVGRRVRLTRKGREYSGLCPFHSEKTPSFTVNDQKGFYHCFGCQAHGDAIKFVCETEGLSFREAVERLAGEAGLSVPSESPMQREREEHRRTLYDVVAAAQAFYRERLGRPGGAATPRSSSTVAAGRPTCRARARARTPSRRAACPAAEASRSRFAR